MFGDILQIIKNLFTSKKKKLILDIKKKHNKNISDYDIYDYRKKHTKHSNSMSDNDILELILLEYANKIRDIEVKSSQFRNNENIESSTTTTNYSSPHVTTCECSNSYKSPKYTIIDNYNMSDSNESNEFSSYSVCNSGGSSSSSSDSSSSSSCD